MFILAGKSNSHQSVCVFHCQEVWESDFSRHQKQKPTHVDKNGKRATRKLQCKKTEGSITETHCGWKFKPGGTLREDRRRKLQSHWTGWWGTIVVSHVQIQFTLKVPASADGVNMWTWPNLQGSLFAALTLQIHPGGQQVLQGRARRWRPLQESS